MLYTQFFIIMEENICCRNNFVGAKYVSKTEVADKNKQDLGIHIEFNFWKQLVCLIAVLIKYLH